MSKFKKCKVILSVNRPQHLYILSEDEIKIGDYYIYPTLLREVWYKKSDNIPNPGGMKVIASTDKSLNLPSPSKSFIEKYCELGGIDEVMVEYVLQYDLRTQDKSQEFKKMPKVSSDNTITIKAIKNSFSREEIGVIINDWFIYTNFNKDKNQLNFHQWFEQNY